jgi:hypothetical protein
VNAWLLPTVARQAGGGFSDSFVDGLGKVVDIVRVQPSLIGFSVSSATLEKGVETHHRNPSILRHIDMCILSQFLYLQLAQSGKAKHANLVCDMFPCPWCPHTL